MYKSFCHLMSTEEIVLKTLEILIPTYGRPASAADAIKSCLSSNDPRISVRCNSNGTEPSLELFRSFDPRLIYDCFETNCGVHANFYHLLSNATARFCMLLSDEDRIDSNGLKSFLDYLDACPETIQVISCSIFDSVNNKYYRRLNLIHQEADVDINVQQSLQLIPSYMSGLVFCKNGLNSVELKHYLLPSDGNAYPHLDIANILLTNGYMRFYNEKLVLKGADQQTGGDGYSHRTQSSATLPGNLDLNPRIYGPRARVRQFYYRDQLIYQLRPYLKTFYYYLAKLNNFIEYSRTVINSPKVVIIEPGVQLANEVKVALFEAKNNNEYVDSIATRLFAAVLTLPPIIRSGLLIILRIISQVLKKFIKFIIFRKW